jgi:hypothetical protein
MIDGPSRMSDYTRRPLTEVEQQIACYEDVVSRAAGGYRMSVYEYTNDLACRQYIEERKERPELTKMWSRVEAADLKFKLTLLPTKCCIHGSYPKSCFWYWGYPPNSPELESDLKAMGAV